MTTVDGGGGTAAPRPVAGLLLAAGGGRRYGQPKALVDLAGTPLVEHALSTLEEGGCRRLVVVLGAAHHLVRTHARLGDAVVVVNAAWRTGLGSSLRLGLAAVAREPVDAAVVMLVDTPGVSAAAVRRVAAPASRSALAVATYHGRRGHPVLLGRDHFPGVAALAEGDVGAKPYLSRHRSAVVAVPCEHVADGADVDRPADLRRFLARPASRVPNLSGQNN